MKPLLLSMQAFGPYGRASEVDFTGLRDGGLFLIHGQTGAGKTSILDGLCFALFGTSSGADRSGEALRSDLAPADLPTEVGLEFSLGQDIYRVVRRPKQMLAKKRGDGKTEAKPKGELYKQKNSTWELIASGDKKTDDRVIELLGMTADQFRQVVVLPQGQFRKFLSASSDAREALLEMLFRTEKYRRLADRLSSLAKNIEEEIRHKRQDVSAHLASVEASDLPSLEARLTDNETKLAEIRVQQAPAEAQFHQATLRRDRARAASKEAGELQSATARSDTLALKRPHVEMLSLRLEKERRSRPVLQADAACQAMDRDRKRFEDAFRAEQTKLGEANTRLKTAQAAKLSLEAQKPELKALEAEQQKLRELWAAAKRLKDESELSKSAQEKYTSAVFRARETEATLERLKLELKKDLEKQKTRVNQSGRIESLRAERKLKTHERDQITEEIQAFTSQQQHLQEAERLLTEAKTTHDLEHRKLLKVRMDFHLSQAALLAKELKAGEACPVCGSLDHPKRAAIAGGLRAELTPEKIEALEVAVRKLADQLSMRTAKRESVSEARERASEKLHARFAGGGDALAKARFRQQQIDGELRAGLTEIDAMEQAESAAKLAESLRLQLESELAHQESELAKRVAARDDARVALEGLRVRIEELEAQVPSESRDLKAIGERGQAIKARLEQLKNAIDVSDRAHEQARETFAATQASLATLTDQLHAKTEEHEGSCRDREQLLRASGFETIEAARTAGLSADEAKRLEAERRELDDQWAAASSRLAELKLESKAFEPWAFELAAREQEFESLDRERADRLRELHTLEAQTQQIRAARERLASLGTAVTTLEERYRVLGRLAGVAQGQPPFNLSRVNFSRFVLASRLDEVLDRASRRLYTMSRGQFTLKRALNHEDKRRSAGLELVVEDSFTGSLRPTASLSGGEGFMASLCLALGLADIVQSELGGVRLDAVFVDEGFGTLDAEALELAMKTLGELQAGGRMVGIISHVPELKDQITRRLFVRKSPEGSSIAWENAKTLTGTKDAASFTEH